MLKCLRFPVTKSTLRGDMSSDVMEVSAEVAVSGCEGNDVAGDKVWGRESWGGPY